MDINAIEQFALILTLSIFVLFVLAIIDCCLELRKRWK